MAVGLRQEFSKAGWADGDIRMLPYKGADGDKTVSLVARWKAAGRAAEADPDPRPHGRGRGQARRLGARPVRLRREGRLFLRARDERRQAGRDRPTAALFKLRRQGFKPTRDIIVFYTGDEETEGRARCSGATEWRRCSTPNMRSTPTPAAARYQADGTLARLRAPDRRENLPGLHAHRDQPRRAQQPAAPRQCDLRPRRPRLRGWRRTASNPMLNETTRAYFTARAKQETGALGQRCGRGSPTTRTPRRPTRSRPMSWKRA